MLALKLSRAHQLIILHEVHSHQTNIIAKLTTNIRTLLNWFTIKMCHMVIEVTRLTPIYTISPLCIASFVHELANLNRVGSWDEYSNYSNSFSIRQFEYNLLLFAYYSNNSNTCTINIRIGRKSQCIGVWSLTNTGKTKILTTVLYFYTVCIEMSEILVLIY